METTQNYELYKPSRDDATVEVDVSLADNFQKIDTAIKGASDVANESSLKMSELSERVDTIVLTGIDPEVFKVPNKQTWIATAEQTDFTILNGKITSANYISIYVGGIIQNDVELVTSMTFRLSGGVPEGVEVYAEWLESRVAVGKVHASTHEKGGQDEIDITRMKNYQELVSNPITDLTTSLEQIALTPKKMGVMFDGETDDTTAFQSVVDFAKNNGIKKIKLPSGKMKISSPITLFSGLEIEGQGYLTEIVIPDDMTNVFVGEGSLDISYEFADDKTTGDTVIRTKTAHNLTDGSLVQVLSQRDSLSTDAGEHWQLGYATPTSGGCYFGEISRIKKVIDSTTIELTGGLLFPSYLNNNTRDLATTKRASSTIRRLTPIRNVVLRNFRISGGYADIAIILRMAYRCLVENVEYTSGGDGSFIIFEDSLSCKADNCRVYYDTSTEMDNTLAAYHYSRNAFKTISSQSCGFVNCYGENATQTFDLTYRSGGRMPSLYCYIKNCETKGARHNCATTHGGTYACSIEDNRFINNLKHGLSTRTRNSIIRGNHVFGGKHLLDSTNTYGLNLYEGWAKDCQIENNIVVGFHYGIQVVDAADPGEQFKRIGGSIANNTISDCNKSIHIDRSFANKYTDHVGLSINDNTIVNPRGPSPYGVYVENYVVGLIIEGNTIDMNNVADSTCVYIAKNASEPFIIENYMYRATKGIEAISTGYDTTAFTSIVSLYLENNVMRNIAISNRYLLDTFAKTAKEAVVSFHPKDDDSVSMGFSSKRWKVIQSVDSISDRVKFFNKTTAAAAGSNTFFIDTADNKLKFKDDAFVVKIVTLV